MIPIAQIEQEILEGKFEFFQLNASSSFYPLHELQTDLQIDYEEVVKQQQRSGMLSQKPIHPRSFSETP